VGTGGIGGGGNGGALFNGGDGTVTESTLAGNLASGGKGGSGGGGVGYTDTGGSGGPGGGGGTAGGGALFNGGRLSLVNCTIAANAAAGGAGGSGAGGGYGTSTGGAGGVGGNGGTGCGALCDTNGLLSMTNCTWALNSALGGVSGAGGAGGYSAGSPGTPGSPGTNGTAQGGLVTAGARIVNCLIATNTPANCCGWLTDAGHNLSSDSACALTNSASLNGVDAKLGPLGWNGGPTLTMSLLAGSAAIDGADDSAAPRLDQRGLPRPAGLAADIGAVEYGAMIPTLAIRQSGATALDLLGVGNANQPCRLLASPDLAYWSSISTNAFGTDGAVVFHVDSGPGPTRSYYRLSMP
jgi:hypothetical protein